MSNTDKLGVLYTELNDATDALDGKKATMFNISKVVMLIAVTVLKLIVIVHNMAAETKQ